MWTSVSPWTRATLNGVGRTVTRLGVSLRQGLTLVHYSAQLEPFLTQKRTLHTPNTPCHPLNNPSTPPKQHLTAPPVTQKALKLSLKVDECKPLHSGGRDREKLVYQPTQQSPKYKRQSQQ